jgi:hypothetical protein
LNHHRQPVDLSDREFASLVEAAAVAFWDTLDARRRRCLVRTLLRNEPEACRADKNNLGRRAAVFLLAAGGAEVRLAMLQRVTDRKTAAGVMARMTREFPTVLIQSE